MSKTEIMSLLPNPIVPWPEKNKAFTLHFRKYPTRRNTPAIFLGSGQNIRQVVTLFVTERKMLGHSTKKAFDRMSEEFLGPH